MNSSTILLPGTPVRFVDWEDFRDDSPEELLNAEGAKGFRCSLLDVSDDQELFKVLAHALHFPDYFGHNWDAVDECLFDMEWMPATAYRLLVTDSGNLWAEHPEIPGRLISSWLGAAKSWKAEGVAFQLVFLGS